ncbi:MAG TPA: hypothetical protein VF723_02805 [Pyrinomonadaceae bacterium]
MSLDLNGARQNEAAVDAGYRVPGVIWLAIMMGVVALFIVTRVVQPEAAAAGDNAMLFWILLALGLVTLGASFGLKYRLLAQSVAQQKPELVRSAYIMSFALCEATGLFGLAAHFITGVRYYYFFFVLSGFGILLHKPQRDDLLAASGGSRFGAHGEG